MFILGALAVAGATAWSIRSSPRALLINTTASEPIGIYAPVDLAPRSGRLVAFKTPAAAFPYADRHLAYLRRVPMLKAVVGVSGDTVCTTTGRLVINGRNLAPILRTDGEGRALPHWRACRVLRPGEIFVFSARVPNSFDSRYFGPVSTARTFGVYVPILTRGEG
jgi:conjugative transfer signal peptidase TraF